MRRTRAPNPIRSRDWRNRSRSRPYQAVDGGADARRAVPTLIIAFLITICLGAFVQVLDQTRQKRAAAERDLTALADYLAERIDRVASVSAERPIHIERMQV